MGSPQFTVFPRPRRQRYVRYLLGIAATIFFISTFQWHRSAFSTRQIQYSGFRHRNAQEFAQPQRQKAVRREFLHAWYGYKDHSWMSDSLMSLTGQPKEQFCGWSATLVDALDTLWIMDLHEEFEEALNATISIDFWHTAQHCWVNLFESTIRYLGGMLAAYDLSGDERLLPKLVELGNILYGQFRTTNGMPCTKCGLITLDAPDHEPPYDAPLADVGSFYLEFARLSQVTGDSKYLNLVGFLTEVFESTQNTSSIPGLWPEQVDAASINGSIPGFATKSHAYSLGALSDSAYEYLLKTHLLLGGITHRYALMWLKAATAISRNLLFRAFIPQWNQTDVLFSGITTHYDGSEELLLEPRIQHLGCFAGGMFAMSGKIFKNPEHLTIGKQLTQGCIWAYENGPIGIMPETVTLLNCPEIVGKQCAWNQTAWQEARDGPGNCTYGGCWGAGDPDFPPGYLSSIDTKYLLRPEAIESVFILYRITGDEYYRDVGWNMFQNIVKHTRTAFGHASLQNVMFTYNRTVFENGKAVDKQLAFQSDEMESFWLAETLKYFWLLFSEPSRISLDDWVLNTEAHPLRLSKGIRGF